MAEVVESGVVFRLPERRSRCLFLLLLEAGAIVLTAYRQKSDCRSESCERICAVESAKFVEGKEEGRC